MVVGELPDSGSEQIAGAPAPTEPSRLGLVIEELTDATRQRSGVDSGVLVRESTGPAAEAGIQPGDVITRINNQEIDSNATFDDVTTGLAPGRSVPVLIVRGQAPTFLALRVPEE
ncbi:MAG: PDZ domain-containing protein [Gammaproteobacteria bacterium]|nr:PDZ domain-containing protein [Gammaproteobacteria bacterium]